jgi:hypothetical protein
MTWIPGFENHYSLDIEGNVYSHKKDIKVKLAPCLGTNGYLYVNLWLFGKCSRESIHRLMAMTYLVFIKSLQVNHINGIKLDNRLSNLEMVTRSDNAKHAFRLGLSKYTLMRGEDNKNSKLTTDDVYKIRKLVDSKTKCHWEIAAMYNVSRCLISIIGRRESWTHLK